MALFNSIDDIPSGHKLTDSETVLSTPKYQPASGVSPVQGAKVYTDGKYYYYRDNIHKGAGSHLEVFDKRGNHIGTADPLTGTIDKTQKVPGRKLNVK